MEHLRRLKKVINWLIFKEIAENERALAETLGYTKSSFSQIVTGKVPLSEKFMKRICSLDENINFVWLQSGEGEMFLSNNLNSEDSGVAVPKDVWEIIKQQAESLSALLNWSPQYLSKLLKGVDFGLQPVVSIIEALPEINARWFLTGQGEMLSDEKQADLRREALEHVYQVMELERFIPVMTPDELRMFERQVREGEKADFSPDTIQSWRERLNVREREINVKFATAAAKCSLYDVIY